MKKLLRRIGKIPHIFAKLTVTHCVVWGTVASMYALNILDRTGQDASATLIVAIGFFGGELLFMCLRTVLAEKKTGEKEKE